MVAITKKKTGLPRTAWLGIGGSAGSALGIGGYMTARRLVHRSAAKQVKSLHHDERRQVDSRRHQQPNAVLRAWDQPYDRRPSLIFDEGDIATLLDIATVTTDNSSRTLISSAARTAILSFVVAHQSSPAIFNEANTRLQSELLTNYPNQTTRANARYAVRMTEQMNDGQLTARLGQYETDYLGLYHGVRPSKQRDLTKLIGRLAGFADILSGRQSQQRQASVRAMLAHLYLCLGRIDEANDQMRRALVLIGTFYESSVLVKLSVKAGGQEVIQETFGSQNPQGLQAARKLSGITGT